MPQLDALRAFAVIGVMYQHFGPYQSWLGYVPPGRIGVQLFFVLSGFLITGILLIARDRIAEGESLAFELRQFYIRRFLRIFPLYYGAVLGAAVLGIDGFSQQILWHLSYSTNIYNAVTGQWAGASAHLWTLSVEEQFYLLWPWIILLTPRRWLIFTVTIFAVAGPVFRSICVILDWSQMALYTLTPASFDAFGCGALLALARHAGICSGDGGLRRMITKWGLILGLPLTVVTFWSLAWPGHWYYVFNIGANLGLALVFVWLIDRAADGFGGRVGLMMTWRPLLFIGKISYGLYLFHLLVQHVVLKLQPRLEFFQGQKPVLEHKLANLFLLTVTTLIVASASWILYERPILALKRFFPYTRKRTHS
ncbi:MAG: acyltransferase [Verrucomicrobiae bacterium]|nr:acyltransferase [Verrucomicrobiae bacterium]